MKISNILIVFILFSITTSAMEPTPRQWKPMGMMNASDRKLHFVNEIGSGKNDSSRLLDGVAKQLSAGTMNVRQAREILLKPGIHTLMLPEFGQAFSFDGTLDELFCGELQSRVDQPTNVLVVAFGVGRSVMDALTIHPNAIVVANDIQERAEGMLKELAHEYNVDTSRLKMLMGDILLQMENLEENAIDIVYCANVIHFFSPPMLEGFFQGLKRIVNPHGKIYLALKEPGFPIWHDAEKMLRDFGFAYPNFIQAQDFGDEFLSPIPLPYHNLAMSDIESFSGASGFTLEKGSKEYLIGCSIDICGKHIPLGDYAISENPYGDGQVCASYYAVLTPSNHALTLSKNVRGIGLGERAIHLKNWQCTKCKKLFERLSQCSLCKAKYCSRECQLADWRAGHKAVCQAN